jgi:hypothetical protein
MRKVYSRLENRGVLSAEVDLDVCSVVDFSRIMDQTAGVERFRKRSVVRGSAGAG